MPLLSLTLVLLSAAMHAGWNLMVREQRAGDSFLRITLLIAVVGLGPALAAEFLGTPILAATWLYALIGGLFLAFYYLGLTKGYRSGDFTVVYPAARGLPVLFVAAADFVRGHPPSPLGWLGLVLVSVGCLLLPHRSFQSIRWEHYRNRTSLWILLTALCTAGYSTVDSLAAHAMPSGLATAVQYNVIETTFSLVAFWIVLRGLDETIDLSGGWGDWKGAALAAVFLFGGYSLVLWAFQLSANASYVLAVRQVSIVMGVVVGAFLFREPAARLRLSAAAIVTVGVIAVGLAH